MDLPYLITTVLGAALLQLHGEQNINNQWLSIITFEDVWQPP